MELTIQQKQKIGAITIECGTVCFEFNNALNRAIKRGKHDLFKSHLVTINDYVTEYKIALLHHLVNLPFREIEFDKCDNDCNVVASTIEHYLNDDYYNFVTILYVYFTKMYKIRNKIIGLGCDKITCDLVLERAISLLGMDKKYVRFIA